MADVLPYVPGFLERLTPYLAQAGQGIGGAIGMAHKKASALENLQKMFPGTNAQGQIDPNAPANATPSLTPIQIASAAQSAKNAFGDTGGKAYIDKVLQDQKIANKEASDIRKEERALLQPANAAFYEKVEKDREVLPELELSSQAMIDGIINGDVGPFSAANLGRLATALGLPDEIRKGLESTDSKEFNAAKKTFISSTLKDSFRGTTNQREIALAEEMLAEIGVGRNANLAAAWLTQSKIDITKERIRLADQLLEEGISPSKIPKTVDKMLQPFVKESKDQYFEAIKALRDKK